MDGSWPGVGLIAAEVFALCLSLPGAPVSAVVDVDVAALQRTRIVPCAGDALLERLGAGGYSFVTADGWDAATDPIGAPQLPQRTVTVELPDGAGDVSVSVAAVWRDFATGVKVMPIQQPYRADTPPEDIAFTAPDAGHYSAAAYPSAHAEALPRIRASGRCLLPIRVTPFRYHPDGGRLEVARSFSLTVSYESPAAQRKAATRKPMSAAPSHLDYVVISPPSLVEPWRWYIGQRKAAHPELEFDVVSTADIYREHPFGPDGEAYANRNPAESIHACIRRLREENGVTYVVLGGPWWNAEDYDPGTGAYRGERYLWTGERLSLENTVPGILAAPFGEAVLPCDQFYACLDLVNGQSHPWDDDGDGLYGENRTDDANDFTPDIVVSRMTLSPWSQWANADGTLMTSGQLLTNYVAKLARAESPDWKGRYRYGLHAAYLGGNRTRDDTAIVLRDERQFYDGAFNMFAPEIPRTFVDTEPICRRRIAEKLTNWRPLLGVEPMLTYNWSPRHGSHDGQVDAFYRAELDFSFVYSHGWEQGASYYQASRFMTSTGLILFNACNMPCLTGTVDYWKRGPDGRQCVEPCMGDGSVSAPRGGCIVSVNNSRVGWFAISLLANFDDGYNAQLLSRVQERLFRDRAETVGLGLMRAFQDYSAQTAANGYRRWCQWESMVFGDPLVALEFPSDDVEVVSSGEVRGAMRFAATGNAVVDGCDLRIQEKATVADGDLTVSVGGGFGRQGLAFVGRRGRFTLDGDRRFYVAAVSNAAEIVLAGGGAVLDMDAVEEGTPLRISAETQPSEPNTLRAATPGRLADNRVLEISNSYVRLETIDAFGEAGMDWSLFGSHLEVRPGVMWPCEGWWEYFSGNLSLDGSTLSADYVRDFAFGRPDGRALAIEASGRSSVVSGNDAVIGLHGTTTVTLLDGATLALAADFRDLGDGKLVFRGSGTVVAGAGLAGRIEVGAGVTLELTALPLEKVEDLSFAAGSTLALPGTGESFFQLVPLSSRLSLPEGVRVTIGGVDAAGGVATSTGSYFLSSALFTWSVAEGEWRTDCLVTGGVRTAYSPESDKVYFAEVAGDCSTVRVSGAVSCGFAYFGNLETAYRFEGRSGDTLTLDGVLFGGPTEFAIPLVAMHSVGVMSGALTADELTTPTVTVSSGATLTAAHMDGVDGAASVRIERGGALTLAGSHAMDLTLADGAILRAADGAALDVNATTALVFEGRARVDVGDVILSATPLLLSAGSGRPWTVSDLDRLDPLQDGAELRVRDGNLYAVAGANLVGPYARSVTGAVTWNGAPWTDAKGTSFTWDETATDWTDDVRLSVSDETALTVDCAVVAGTVSVESSAGASLRIATDGTHAVTARQWDFSACACDVVLDQDLSDAQVIASPSNTVLGGAAEDVQFTMVGGSTVRLMHPGTGWRLYDLEQGVLEAVPPVTGCPFAIAAVPPEFTYPTSGFEVRLVDASGVAMDMSGWAVEVRGGALTAVPPPVSAVAAGTVRWSELDWRDARGGEPGPIDWGTVAEATLTVCGETTIALDACVAERLTIVGSGPVTFIAADGHQMALPREILSAADIAVADGLLPQLELFESDRTLTLAGGTTSVEVFNGHRCALDGRKVTVGADATLEIVAREAAMQHEVDLSGVAGEGTLHCVSDGAGGIWFSTPLRQWAGALDFRTDADLAIGQAYNAKNLEVRNLSGTGTFRSDYQSGPAVRTVRTVQTRTTEWSGSLKGKSGNRDSALTVASTLPAPSADAALVLSGTAVAEHVLTIETNGCVVLTGSWKGEIVNDGLLVVTERSSIDRAITGSGTVVTQSVSVAVTVPAGTNLWSALAWTDATGAPVRIFDWGGVTNVAMTIEGTPCTIVFDIGAFDGAVAVAGDTVGERTLALGDDSEYAALSALLAGAGFACEVPRGRTLTMAQCDWSAQRIFGEGTVALRPGSVTANYTSKGSIFAGTLDVALTANAKYAVFGDTVRSPLFVNRPELHVTSANPAESTQALILNSGVVDCPLEVRNFSGDAYVRCDYNKVNGLRTIDTLMTEDREYSGIFMDNGDRKASLTVRGDGLHALTLSGASATRGTLTVTGRGRARLSSAGSWANGRVCVDGGAELSVEGAKSFAALTLADGSVLSFEAARSSIAVAAPVADGVVVVDPGPIIPTGHGVRLISWTTAPTAEFRVRQGAEGCEVEKRADGVYLVLPVMVPVAGTDVRVPRSWILDYPVFVDLAGGDLELAVLLLTGKTGVDGQLLRLWQDYVAGTDPGDPSDVFRTYIGVTNGVPYIWWSPDLNTNGIVRRYTVYGRSDLSSASTWMTPTNGTHRFFRVTVSVEGP